MSKRSYKIGDKVRVRKDLVMGKRYGNITLLADMAEMRGKQVTIANITFEGNYDLFESKYTFSGEMFEAIKFTKADLKTGHIVTTRCGEKFVVFKNLECKFDKVNVKDPDGNYFVNIDTIGYNLFDEYDDNLCVRKVTASGFDIMKVEEVDTVVALTNERGYNLATKKTLWERPVPKKMTKAEIEKELGYEIELED